MEFKEQLKFILYKLEEILENAPMEEDCNDIENDMFADMQNLVESINAYLEEE